MFIPENFCNKSDARLALWPCGMFVASKREFVLFAVRGVVVSVQPSSDMPRTHFSRTILGSGAIVRPSAVIAVAINDAGENGRPVDGCRTGKVRARSLPAPRLVTAERLEAALLVLATLIEADGDIHVALFERLEAELATIRRVQRVRNRARELLTAHDRAHEPFAIERCNHACREPDRAANS